MYVDENSFQIKVRKRPRIGLKWFSSDNKYSEKTYFKVMMSKLSRSHKKKKCNVISKTQMFLVLVCVLNPSYQRLKLGQNDHFHSINISQDMSSLDYPTA